MGQEIKIGVAAVIILIGIILGFFGYSMFKKVIAATGAIFGFWAGGVLGLILSLGNPIFAIVGAVVGGIVGGVLFVMLYFAGVFFAGACLGALFGLMAFPFAGGLLGHLLIGALAFAGGIAALLVQKALIISSTALTGSFMIANGVVYFVRGSFYPIIRYHSVPQNEAAAFISFWLMLGMAAVYMQYRFGKDGAT